jgi:ATP-dependent helicase/nuclease subunit A
MTTGHQQSFRFSTAADVPPPPRRNLVIEAGAGTGKTTAIVAEVLRLLLSDENLNPERIVLVTFTEKAAGQIADRVHSALTEIELQTDKDTVRWPIGSDKPLLEIPATESVRRACAKQLGQIEKLRSQTIHSFCQTLLRQHALEAGIDPQFRIIEGFERARFYGEVYDAWIDHETRVKPTPQIVREWEDLLDDADYLFMARGRIFSLLERRDLLLDDKYTLGEMVEMEPQLEEAIRIVSRCTKESAIADALRAAKPPKSGSGIEAWIEYFAPVAEAILTENLHRDACDVAIRVLRMHKDKGNSIYDVLVKHRAAVALLSLTRRFIARLDAEKRAQSVADFDDLLIQTLTLLENEVVLERVRKQFDYIFVDEFQDTDRIQARIIDRLGRDSTGRFVPGKTIVVGDPKQSIYGFRRADPELYAKTTETLIRGDAEPRVLKAQYRSEPALLQAINVLTKKVLEGGERDPNVFRPEFHELIAARKTEHEDDAPLTMLACDAEEGESRLTREAEVIANWIANAKDFRRYAILFRRMTQIDAYLDVFDSRGIPYVLPPTRQFLERPAPVDLLAVLRAIAYPTDLGAEISAARTPYFALTDPEIVARGDAYSQFTAVLNSLRGVASHLTLTQLIDRIVGSTDIEAVYATCADGGRSLRHLEHLRSIAFGFDQSSGGSVRQFVDEISRRREEPDEVEPALFDETRNAVRILTIHGSKGLEFETVILPDLLVAPRHPEVMTVEEPPSLVMFGSLCGYARKSGDRCLNEIGGLREDAENRRLFYVAVTRAKRDVAFVIAPGAKKVGFSKYLQEALGPLDESLWPDEPGREVRGMVAYERTESAAGNRSRKKLIIDVPAEVEDSRLPLPIEEPSYIHGNDGRQAGILLHRVLERWDGKSDVHELLKLIAAEQGIDGTRVAKRLEVVKKSPMLQRIARAETIGREMPISVIENGVILNRRIDRVIREADGDTVIDYKSGEPSPDRVSADREQIARYCAAMERLTSRPHRGVLWYIDDARDIVLGSDPRFALGFYQS